MVTSRRTVGHSKFTQAAGDDSSVGSGPSFASQEHVHQFEQEIDLLTPLSPYSNLSAFHDNFGVYKVGNLVGFTGVVACASGAALNSPIVQVPAKYLPADARLPMYFRCHGFCSFLSPIRRCIVRIDTDYMMYPGSSNRQWDYIMLNRIRYAYK